MSLINGMRNYSGNGTYRAADIHIYPVIGIFPSPYGISLIMGHVGRL